MVAQMSVGSGRLSLPIVVALPEDLPWQKDWIMAETQVRRLTQKQKMKSRAVEEIQRRRIAIAEKIKRHGCSDM